MGGCFFRTDGLSELDGCFKTGCFFQSCGGLLELEGFFRTGGAFSELRGLFQNWGAFQNWVKFSEQEGFSELVFFSELAFFFFRELGGFSRTGTGGRMCFQSWKCFFSTEKPVCSDLGSFFGRFSRISDEPIGVRKALFPRNSLRVIRDPRDDSGIRLGARSPFCWKIETALPP